MGPNWKYPLRFSHLYCRSDQFSHTAVHRQKLVPFPCGSAWLQKESNFLTKSWQMTACMIAKSKCKSFKLVLARLPPSKFRHKLRRSRRRLCLCLAAACRAKNVSILQLKCRCICAQWAVTNHFVQKLRIVHWGPLIISLSNVLITYNLFWTFVT